MSITSRRSFLLRSSAATWAAHAASAAELSRNVSYAEEHPDMLLSYLGRGLEKLDAHWDRERAKVQTAEALEARNAFVREKFEEMIGGYPERTPLDPVIRDRFERAGHRVENVMFQSRPDFWVTGNLYIPNGGKGPFPGIISPCGHYALARMQPDYQYAYLSLVKAGFVVLAFDPIGQGERRHYWNPQTGETEVGNAIYEHSMPGQLLLLLGENLTQYRIWDCMRAIDYLLERPEVDPERIGCAGHSGGGTLTLFVSALDQRVRCAVVNQGGTGHRWPMHLKPESAVGPADVEQNLFPAAIHGVDLPDLHSAIAPRPLLALIEYFTPRFNKAAEEIQKAYDVAGVPERFATEEAGDPHAWTMKLRQATTNWFSRWFYNKPGPKREPIFEHEAPEKLYCTPNGSIRTARQGHTIFSLILEKQANLPPDRGLPAERSDLESHRKKVTGEIRDLTRFKADSSFPLNVRHLMTTRRKGYRIEKQEFLSEPGIHVSAWVFLPDDARTPYKATLFANGNGKRRDGMEFGLLEKLAQNGHMVVAVDVRGIGETAPNRARRTRRTNEFSHLFDVETAMAYIAWFMDESLLGMRVGDIVRSIDYVLARDDVEKSGVRLIARGHGALWSLYAAALDDRVHGLLADRALLSYKSLTQTDRYLHSASIFAPGILNRLDLPHVAGAVANRDLVILDPVDPMGRPTDLHLSRRTYAWTRALYSAVGAEDRFEVTVRSPGSDPADAYRSFLHRRRA